MFPRRQAGEGVGEEEAMFCVAAQEEVVIVSAVRTMGTQHSHPGILACPVQGTEVARENPPVRLRHSLQEVFVGGLSLEPNQQPHSSGVRPLTLYIPDRNPTGQRARGPGQSSAMLPEDSDTGALSSVADADPNVAPTS
nr:unnamed protein product [Spirometra erinaceieuropaei]